MWIQYAVPALTGLLILTVLWNARVKSAKDFNVDIQHLRQSANLLRRHKDVLEQFLRNDAASQSLKRLLISHSDAMSDREFVKNVAKVLVNDKNADLSSDDQEIVSSIYALRKADPDIFSLFVMTIVTGTYAAILRWPESAMFFEEISAKMAADPKHDVGVAVTASRFRKSNLPFSVAVGSEAIA